jgi:hypothetical protein
MSDENAGLRERRPRADERAAPGEEAAPPKRSHPLFRDPNDLAFLLFALIIGAVFILRAISRLQAKSNASSA